MITDLAWIIPICPFVAFALIAVFLHRNQRLSQWAALLGIGFALSLSQIVVWSVIDAPDVYQTDLFTWFESGSGSLKLGVYIDPPATLMVFMVPLVCMMIFIYSVGYMRGDSRRSRFFAYISLFAAGMLGLVICDNLLAFFVFWELMGTCSYLLIGFWYEKRSAYEAGLKAFLVTKVGDLFLLLGIALLYAQTGTLDYESLFTRETLRALSQQSFMSGPSVATVVTLLLVGGTVGKSAQFPLHTWLPDAMEGPTPASSLIHAATMVSAGVFLIVRMYPLFLVSETLPVVAVIGSITALFSSVIAVTQRDIKRVLAFSTISQLGYMVAALGIGAYVAGLFHLLTHAFFKALLFMGAGSVIHSIEHGYHRMHGHAVPTSEQAPFNPNDMFQMGGLGLRMPVTTLTFLAGSLSLSGFPLFTSGFWSKDEILNAAWSTNRAVFWVLAISAGLTAFYVSRQLCLVFLGKPRSRAAVYARENRAVMVVPMVVLALFAIALGWIGVPHDFPLLGRIWAGGLHSFLASTEMGMAFIGRHGSVGFSWPSLLISLAFALTGLAAGWVVYGYPPLVREDEDPLHATSTRLRLEWIYRFIRDQFRIDGLYRRLWVIPSLSLAKLSDWLDRRVLDRIPIGIGRAVVGGAQLAGSVDQHFLDGLVSVAGALSRLLAGFLGVSDSAVVDGLVGGVAQVVRRLGRRARDLQTGIISDYLWNALVTVLLLVAFLILFQRF